MKRQNATRFLVLLLLTSCATPSLETQGKVIKGSVDAARVNCLVLMGNPAIPREANTIEYCARLSGVPCEVK